MRSGRHLFSFHVRFFSSKPRPVGVGFLGGGDISTLHYEGIRQLGPKAKLVGVWNRPSDPLGFDTNARAKQYNCRAYDSAEALCKDPAVDIVYVLTNAETHHQYALTAIRSGKHVFVEKPVGMAVKEVKDLKEESAKHNVLCVPGHNYIYESSVTRTKELLDSGKLGKLCSIYIMYNIYHPEPVAKRYPGVIRQILTHNLYLTLYLLGKENPVVEVSAMKSTINDGSVEQENLAMVTGKTRSGALVHLSASFANDDHSSDPWSFYMKVVGQAGATRFSYNDWVENKKAIVHSHTYSAYPYSIINISKYLIEEVLGRGQPPLSTIDDAVRCQELIELIEASVAKKKAFPVDH